MRRSEEEKPPTNRLRRLTPPKGESGFLLVTPPKGESDFLLGVERDADSRRRIGGEDAA